MSADPELPGSVEQSCATPRASTPVTLPGDSRFFSWIPPKMRNKTSASWAPLSKPG